MVYHNYDLDDGKYDNLDTYFSFPFAYNEKDDSQIVKNQRELKKFFKKIKKPIHETTRTVIGKAWM